MISSDDDFVFEGETCQPIDEGLEFLLCSDHCEVAGMDEDVRGGFSLEFQFRMSGMCV